MGYGRRRGEVKSVVHWGQRMLSEIEFLTLYADPDIVCVYAGAAPGAHIIFLSQMFSEVNFVLVDPSNFTCKATDRICIRQEFMTDEVAKEVFGIRTLLISDIRSADFKITSNNGVEVAVARDINWLMNWHLIMQPIAGMYKFRLPWTDGQTPYLSGETYLPIWGLQTTTESRLIVTGSSVVNWDHKSYEERMFYFNNITRCNIYDHDITSEGLDHCFDCASEVSCLKDYLCKHFSQWFSALELQEDGKCPTRLALASKNMYLVERLTVECGGSMHGRNLVNWQKKGV